jgi:DedD protein
MRDFEQMREKIQVSLEGRQVAALAFGALVLLCSVFALGLAVGRKLSQEAPRPADLTALDVQAEPPAVKPQPAKPPEPKPAEAAPKVAEAAPKPAEVKPKPAPVNDAALADTHGEAAVIPPPPREALVVPPAPKPQPAGGISLTPPPKDLGAYTVQIGASPDKAQAQQLETKARAAGLKPYVVEANLGAKGTWYRVRVGSFPDKDKASRYRSDVERELRSTAIVMASH